MHLGRIRIGPYDLLRSQPDAPRRSQLGAPPHGSVTAAKTAARRTTAAKTAAKTAARRAAQLLHRRRQQLQLQQRLRRLYARASFGSEWRIAGVAAYLWHGIALDTT